MLVVIYQKSDTSIFHMNYHQLYKEVHQWVSRARVVWTFDEDLGIVFDFLAATWEIR